MFSAMLGGGFWAGGHRVEIWRLGQGWVREMHSSTRALRGVEDIPYRIEQLQRGAEIFNGDALRGERNDLLLGLG